MGMSATGNSSQSQSSKTPGRSTFGRCNFKNWHAACARSPNQCHCFFTHPAGLFLSPALRCPVSTWSFVLCSLPQNSTYWHPVGKEKGLCLCRSVQNWPLCAERIGMSILNWVLLEVDFLSQFGLVSCMIFCCGRPVNVQVSRFPKMQARNTHTQTHTLAQKHLIELLMWNASYVQKTPPVTPDRTWWMTRREKQCKEIFLRPC